MSVRQYLVRELKPLLPKKWGFIEYDTNVDTIASTVVMLKMQELEPLPATPRAGMTVSYVVTIVTPHTDPEQAEADLDDTVIDLIAAIRKIKNVVWKSARRVVFGGTNQAYDITLEITTS